MLEGERMPLVMARCLAHRKKWADNHPEKFGSCRRNMGKNIRKKRKQTIKNITGGK